MRRLAASAALLLLLSGCAFGPGTQDWTLRSLPGSYEIWRVNSQSIELCIGISETGAAHVLGPYVCAAGWTEDWIFVQLLPQRDSDAPVSYYAVSVDSAQILGPFDTEAALSQAVQTGIPVWYTAAELADMARSEEQSYG